MPAPSDHLVPTIDISSFLAGTDLVTAPEQIRRAATTSGFFQIVGHGIDKRLIDDAYAAGEALAARPAEERLALTSPSGHPYRGVRVFYDKAGRICSEGFTASRFEGPEDAVAAGVAPEHADYYAENVWPDLPGFRESLVALAGPTRALGRQMMRAFAVALELPIDWFDDKIALDATTSTIRSYPARHAPLDEDPTIIFDEHFDGNLLTLLHQRGTYEGLQIRDLDGEWFSVPVDDDAFVVNVGELMTRWTNGTWPATRHRVIAAADPEGYRFTLPTFFNASVDTVVAPLSTQGGEDDPRYEPVTVYDWFRRHTVKSYAERSHTLSGARTEEFVAALATSSSWSPAAD